MKATMDAIKTLNSKMGLQAIIIYPNSDAGSQAIIEVINKYKSSNIQIHKSFSRPDFIGLLKVANVLVGNSSCAVAEIPSLHLPVVNIGDRQKGREMFGNIVHAKHDKVDIEEKIQEAVNIRKTLDLNSMPYYKENTEENILKALLGLSLPDVENDRSSDNITN